MAEPPGPVAVPADCMSCAQSTTDRAGSFEWDPRSDALVGCPGYAGLFAGVPPTGQAMLARLAVADAERLAALRAALTPVAPTYAASLRLLRPGGGETLLEERGWGIFDAAGVLLRVTGTVLDLGSCMHAERALLREQAFLRRVIDATPSLIFVKDATGRFLLGNEALARAYGTTTAAVVGCTDGDFNANAAEVAHFLADDREVMASRRPRRIAEEPVSCADGQVRWFSTLKVPLLDADGGCTRVLGVASDITERRRAEEVLQKADRRKDEFLAMLAHELRNPLAPIRNAAHIIGGLGDSDPRLGWACQIIEQQVSHLARLMDDLLDVSRIAQGKIVLRKKPVELAELLAQTLETGWPLMERRCHKFSVHLPDRPVPLEVDTVRLSQVLLNLLDNAAKYTPEGGRIELRARIVGEEVEISVRDNGVGIAPALQPRIFDLFQQDERTLDRSEGGLGLGLTLVRRFTELHGGRVAVHSEGEGCGSTFTLWLPLQAHPAVPSPLPVAPSAPARLRVLVVDDDTAVADSTAMWLDMEGHELRVAYDGATALQQIAEFRPDFVLMDIGLRGISGYEMARRLRVLPEGRKLCLVAVSGYGDEDTRSRALAAGCDRYLVKPVDLNQLSVLLAEVAQRRPRRPVFEGDQMD